MRRPRGPRKVRSMPETNPNVTRSPRPPGLARANTGVPMPAWISSRTVIAISLVASNLQLTTNYPDVNRLRSAHGRTRARLVTARRGADQGRRPLDIAGGGGAAGRAAPVQRPPRPDPGS